VATNSESTITEEVESRLDDIFREDETPPDLSTEAGNLKGSPHGDMNDILPVSGEDIDGGQELPSGILSEEELPDLDIIQGDTEEPPPIELEEEPAGLKIDFDDVEDSQAIELSKIFHDSEENMVLDDSAPIGLEQESSGLEVTKGNTEEPPPIESGEESIGLKIDSDDVEDPPPIELSEMLSDIEERDAGGEGFAFDKLNESSQTSPDSEQMKGEAEEPLPIEIMDESRELKADTDYIDSAYLIEQAEKPPEPELTKRIIPGSPLEELRAIVLSIDWEIDDQIMTKMIEHVEGLKEIYGGDKAIRIFLQILGSLGKYMKVNGANAHPNTIQVMNSLFLALEKVIASEDIGETERKRILLEEATKFKKLKEEISLRKAHSEKKREPRVLKEAKPSTMEDEKLLVDRKAQMPVKGVAPHEAFAFALEEIREVIKAEFRILRAELKLWREDG